MRIHLSVRVMFAVCAGALFVGMLPLATPASAEDHAGPVVLRPLIGPQQVPTFDDVRRPIHVARARAREEERIEAILAKLERARERARQRARARAREQFVASHRCPVDHPRIYSNDFGDPRGADRTHQGIDMVAPFGTPIRAPWPGWVEEGVNGLGGNFVRLHGNGGYLYVSHMQRHAGVSGNVDAAAIIGYVGDSGAARGGPPHAHVEWHPGGGRAVNPYRRLNELCGARTGYDRTALRFLG